MAKLRNLTGKARALRAAAGGALIVAAAVAWQHGTTAAALALAGAGLGSILSGLLGFCPACALAGRCRLRGTEN
ncbi:YgaP-like transmembrane domain [Pseudoduganella chitinolytica]|uniref:DUF2892 domain-containing protein n=1 Tax=Pseudoduganella chitinolytica TaxID=34070 RepID=A0ABY8B997_9BURK|nr:YgaP-like transmembrane domain [Pseudoduganella chitinolytica]WEF31327.1 DUF2892 domain-containing protein [Pseudoduganella chitinolytica]